MDKSGRIFLGIICAFVIIAAGFAAGFHFHFKMPSFSAPVSEYASADLEPNNNSYDISPPSRGPVIVTYPIKIKPADNESFVTIPTVEAGPIKTGQKILLYAENGAMLEMVGEVTKITQPNTEDAPDVAVVHFVLNADEEQPASSVIRGEIVIAREASAPRLPLTALIRNEKGETSVWEAAEGEDGTHTAYLKRTLVKTTPYGFFVMDQASDSNGDYILNPDEKLRDGQTINVNMTLYAGPPHTDDQKMERLMLARQERLRASREERDRAAADELARHEDESSADNNAGCNIADDFSKTAKKLSEEAPAASSSTAEIP